MVCLVNSARRASDGDLSFYDSVSELKNYARIAEINWLCIYDVNKSNLLEIMFTGQHYLLIDKVYRTRAIISRS